MMIAVAERTREIGIRKAIGATPLSIMGQIVAEATVLTGAGGVPGAVAGVGGAADGGQDRERAAGRGRAALLRQPGAGSGQGGAGRGGV